MQDTGVVGNVVQAMWMPASCTVLFLGDANHACISYLFTSLYVAALDNTRLAEASCFLLFNS